jgi:adenosine deaminase
MSVERFIAAMPKVELYVHLEGAYPKEILALIAEQNDVPLKVKHYDQILRSLDNPDYTRIDDLMRNISQWIQQPEDLTRTVYELGVSLAKQNVRYAEVGICPLYFLDQGMTFEQFLSAVNDGRNRVERAWRVRLAWILYIPVSDPRRAEDVLRWATNTAARKGGVVGFGVMGREIASSLEDFERVLRTAQKKGIPRVVQAGNTPEAVQLIVEHLAPERLVGSGVGAEDTNASRTLSDQKVAYNVAVTGTVRSGLIFGTEGHPIRRMFDDGLHVCVGTGLPSLYHTTLSNEYTTLIRNLGFSVGEIQMLCLNAVQASFQEETAKQSMQAEFMAEFARLRLEYQISEENTGAAPS